MYTNNAEYRQAVRQFFGMDFSQAVLNPDIDEETQDELLYDELTSKKATDEIYSRTKDCALFQYVYDIGASKFFSTDREIGLVVLCSYDFFEEFKQAYEEFMLNPAEYTADKETYIALVRAIV